MSEASRDLQVGQALRDRFEAGEIYVPSPDLTWLDLIGGDRAPVLGNLTTNHVSALSEREGLETFVTNVRGKTVGHGTVYELGDRLRFCTVPGQYDSLSEHIDRYVIREDVELRNASEELFAVFWPGVRGSKLDTLLGTQATAAPRLGVCPVRLDNVSVQAFQVPWTRDADWLLVVPRAEAEALEAALVAHDVLPGGEAILHCGRIAQKYPWFGLDCIDTNLPQEMDRDSRTIDFQKGCYLGQETVARLDAMGQVQKKLTLWKFDGDQVPTAGMELRSGEKVVATVTSGTFCFGHEAPLALCLARRTHFDVGSRAASPIGEAEVIG